MAQFDVHRLSKGRMAIDCQADLLDYFDSRLVIPLVPVNQAPPLVKRLNPVFSIHGRDHVMLTQAATAVPARELGEVIGSLKDRSFEITDAIDVLISGV